MILKKEGVSNARGYLKKTPFAEYADRATNATNDKDGKPIHATYGKFGQELTLYNGQNLTEGIYLVSAFLHISGCHTAIIRYDGQKIARAFLGVSEPESKVEYYVAEIQNGNLSVQRSSDGIDYSTDTTTVQGLSFMKIV